MKRIGCVAALVLGTAFPLHAGVPFESDDAGTVEVGAVEVEYAGSWLEDREAGSAKRSHDGELSLTTGISKRGDVGVTIPYTFQEKVSEGGTSKGFGDISVGMKYRFAEMGGLSFAVAPSLTLPTGDTTEGRSEKAWIPGVTLIMTHEMGESGAIHANAGYSRYFYTDDAVDDSSNNDALFFSLALEGKVTKAFSAGVEAGTANPLEKGNGTWNSFALVGCSYTVREGFDLNAALRFGLNKGEDDYTILYGATVTF